MNLFDKKRMRDELEELDTSFGELASKVADKGTSDEMLLLERLTTKYYVVPRKPFEDIAGQFDEEIEEEKSFIQKLERELVEERGKFERMQEEYYKKPARDSDISLSLLKTKIFSIEAGLSLEQEHLKTLEEGRKNLPRQ